MKKLVLFVIVCGLLIGGCAKNNPVGPPTPDPTPIPIPVPNPVPTSKSPLPPVPKMDLTEIINVAVNKDFADKHPEWTGNAGQIITDINTVLEKSGCEKRYALNQTITYPDAAALYGIGTDFAYFSDNNFIGKPIDIRYPQYGGTTIVFWVRQTDNEPLPQFFVDNGGNGIEIASFIGGKKHYTICIASAITTTPLLGKNAQSSNGSYDSSLWFIEYYFGGMHGCGAPMWNYLACSDNSGTLPNLAYNLSALYPKDPMGKAGRGGESVFSPFDAWLIDHNANHQIDANQIIKAAQGLGIKVKVTKPSGYIIQGAAVTVYNGVSSSGAAVNMETVLQTVTTNEYGEAVIRKTGNPWDFNTSPWLLIGVKASLNGRNAGAVITTIDLEEYYLKNGAGAYVLTLVLPDVVTEVAKK